MEHVDNVLLFGCQSAYNGQKHEAAGWSDFPTIVSVIYTCYNIFNFRYANGKVPYFMFHTCLFFKQQARSLCSKIAK